MPTQYPRLREASVGGLSDRQIESALRRQNLEAGAVEDILSDLGNLAASALPMVGTALGSLIPIPGVGQAIGGALGNLTGSALHSAIGPGTPQPAAPAPAASGGLLDLLQGLPGAPAATQASSQQTVAMLLQALSQPGMLQALASMLLGPVGKPTVPVANNQVPVSAFTNLLSTLATQASEAYNAERAVSGYAESAHYGGGWTPRIDVASPEARAGALLNLMSSEANPLRDGRKRRLKNLAQALRQADAMRAGA